jgi:biopolymer transport protein ExbD
MRRIEHPQIELQIAPLIDVCFLLLFFYILTSKPEQPEGTLPSSLPGTAALETPLEIPDEQRLTLLAGGQVLVNEQQFDSAASRDLPQLRHFLSRLKEAADAHKGRPLVTIDAADALPHQRLLEVLHACTQSGIGSVSFATNPGEEH